MAIAAIVRGVDPRRHVHRLRRWLALAVPGAIASVLLLAGVMLYLQAAAERRALEERAQAAASAMAHAIEREIATAVALLRGLATSPVLQAGDLKAFYDQLVATEVPDGTWLVLSDKERQVLNTRRPYGEPLPAIAESGPDAVAGVERVHRLGWSATGRMYGPVSRMRVILVSVSVPRPDRGPKYILTARLSEERVRTLLAEPALPSGSTAAILDRHGRLLVATQPNSDWNAPPVRHWLADLVPPNTGVVRTVNPAGVPVQVAYAKARNVEWTAAIKVPLQIINAPVNRAVRNLAIGGGLLLALGTIVGALLARRWQRPIDELSAAAARGESKRLEAEAQVEHTRGLLRASSNALPARLAILDARGNVVFANEAWRNFARSRQTNGSDSANYLKVCEAPVLREALRRLMKGKRRAADAVYRIEGSPEESWYQAHLARFEHKDITWFVVAHEDITEVKAARQAVHHLTDHLTSLQEKERQRIASELHDSTSQHLVGIGLNLMRLRSVLGASAAGEEIYRDINVCLQEAQKELRIFTYLLYPPSLGSEGLKATAERFVDGFAMRAGLKMHCKIDHGADRASLDVQRALFRVLQEALTNVHRHAVASRVLVLLQAGRQELRLFVKDNGKGLGSHDAANAGRDVPLGVGIPGMRARVRQLGGILTVTSARRGTVVRALVPLRSKSWGRPNRDKPLPPAPSQGRTAR